VTFSNQSISKIDNINASFTRTGFFMAVQSSDDINCQLTEISRLVDAVVNVVYE